MVLGGRGGGETSIAGDGDQLRMWWWGGGLRVGGGRGCGRETSIAGDGGQLLVWWWGGGLRVGGGGGGLWWRNQYRYS